MGSIVVPLRDYLIGPLDHPKYKSQERTTVEPMGLGVGWTDPRPSGYASQGSFPNPVLCCSSHEGPIYSLAKSLNEYANR